MKTLILETYPAALMNKEYLQTTLIEIDHARKTYRADSVKAAVFAHVKGILHLDPDEAREAVDQAIADGYKSLRA